MSALHVFACVACGDMAFPARLLCPACGASEFAEVTVTHGVVEQVTVLHRRPGGHSGEPSCIGTVLTDAGPRVIARLEEALQPGGRAILQVDDLGAIFAFGI
jgi:uncharacterized protein